MKDMHVLFPFPLGAIKPNGFLAEQLRRTKDGMTGHLYELEPEMFWDPYTKKGERSQVAEWAPENMDAWGGEISANYWTGYIETAFMLGDEAMIRKATEWIDATLENQQPDGYLGTYRYPDFLIYEDYNAFACACAVHALLAFYEVTGREDVLNAAYRSMLWFCDKWADHKTFYAGVGISESMLLVYELTKDERLLTFAEQFLEYLAKHSIYGNSYRDMLSDSLPYTSNHTVAASGTARNPLRFYMATGREEMLLAAENQIKKLRAKAMHLTGSPVSMVEYLGPVGGTTETEYCNYTRLGQVYSMLIGATGKACYGEFYEEMFYNGAEGARKKDERALAYLSAPNQHYATTLSSTSIDDYQAYTPCFYVSCCAANGTRTVPEFIGGMWRYRDDALYALMYGPSTVRNEQFAVREETMYPFRNSVRFVIEREKTMSLCMRIPSWAEAYVVSLNGEEVNAEEQDGFAVLHRDFSFGDTVEISFRTSVKTIKIDDSHYMSKHPIAIRYGALVYSYHIPESWQPFLDKRTHAWKDGWSAYNVWPVYEEAKVKDPHEQIGLRRLQISWNIALDENLTAADFEVEERETTGYVWEDAPILLHTHCYKAPDLCAPYAHKTFEPYLEYQRVTARLPLTLEPYGCTNLRVTYFPKADLSTLDK